MLFIKFYYGDIYGSSESFWWELLKAFLAVIPVLIGILYQRHHEQKKEEKKRQQENDKENERLRLQLFNFNEHLKGIIKSSESVVPPFSKFSQNILAAPFEEHILWERISVPDLYRINELNKDNIFSAFLLSYDDKLKGAKDYREAYGTVQFYKTIYETLYSKYDTISQDIYYQKLKFKDRIFTIKKEVTEIIINNDSVIDPYKIIKESIQTFSKKEKEIPTEQLTLQFFVDNLLEPLGELLPKYDRENSIRQLYILVIENLNLRDDIIHSSKELGKLIGENVVKIPESIDKLKPIVTTLTGMLQQYYKVK